MRLPWGKLWDKILVEADDREDRKFAREQLDLVRQQMSLSSPPPPPIRRNPSPIPVPPPSPTPASSPTSSLLTVSFETVWVNDKGEIVQKIPEEAQYFREDLGDGVTFDMIKIEGGTFDMGSDEYDLEKPIHQVTVPSFYMGKFVVTQAVYEKVMGKNPATAYDADRFVDPNKPVINVSWNDAIAFCNALNELSTLGQTYRLPSEAEWEYACRAKTTTPFHFGPTLTMAIANYEGNYNTHGNGPKGDYRQQTTPVGSFPPNAFGLHDMHGNVWEWCEDQWHKSYEYNEGALFIRGIKIAPNDGTAWIEDGDRDRRVLRGGSWDYNPSYCGSANRIGGVAFIEGNYFGFRLVCSSPRTNSF